MKVTWLAAAVLLTSAAARAESKTATTVLYVAAETSLAIDMFQTLGIKKDPYRTESNLILGPRPGDAKVYAYFGSIMAAQTLLYLYGPDWLSCRVSKVTLIMQVPIVTRNFIAGVTLTL